MKTASGTAPAARASLESGVDEKTCEHCGRVVTRSELGYAVTNERWRARRFCSRKCDHQAHRKYPKPAERVCAREGCENPFTPTAAQMQRGYGRFCSRECDHEAHRIHPLPEERDCARCGTPFIPEAFNVARGWGSFCSRRCSALSTAAHEKRAGRMVACAQCGQGFWRYDSELRGERNFCTSRCWGLYRWAHGVAISRDLVSLVTGRARQRHLGRWGGRKPPAHGSRPRGRPHIEVTDAQGAEITRLRQQGWGRRAIANRLGLSERAVRNALDQP